MNDRIVIDRLRQEYSSLRPEMAKVERLLVDQVRWHLKFLAFDLKPYERIETESRIKECESAINTLKRKFGSEAQHEFEKGSQYNLKDLKDLVGLRILVFPPRLKEKVKDVISNEFKSWNEDHNDKLGLLKFDGFINKSDIGCEIQIVSLLAGLFLKVEHFAFYKPDPSYITGSGLKT